MNRMKPATKSILLIPFVQAFFKYRAPPVSSLHNAVIFLWMSIPGFRNRLMVVPKNVDG